MSQVMYQDAIKFLRKDHILRKIIDANDLPIFEDRSDNLFASLVRSIANQQLSGKAADTILGRFLSLFKSKSFPKPEEILKKTDEEIRGVGFSYPKVRYIKGLALMVVKKEIDLKKLPKMKDEEVIAELIKIKGVGKWTAEMILIFSLGRPDIFSLGDLGLTTAVSKLYNIERKDLKKIEKISMNWIPYRSIASWYLWRSLDNRPKV